MRKPIARPGRLLGRAVTLPILPWICLPLALTPWWEANAAAAILVLLLIHQDGMRRSPELGKPLFWIFLFGMAGFPLLKGSLTVSDGQLALRTVLRAFTLYAAVLHGTRHLDADRLRQRLQPLLGVRTALSLAMALNLLPMLRESLLQRWSILVLRGAWPYHPWLSLRYLAGASLLHAALLSEALADAVLLRDQMQPLQLLPDEQQRGTDT